MINNNEFELKFAVKEQIDNFYELIKNCDFIKDNVASIVSEQYEDDLNNTYFDTSDRELFKRRMGLRIREGKDFKQMTLKISKGVLAGIHDRYEYNVALDENVTRANLNLFTQVSFPFDFDVQQINEQLIQICQTNFKRKSIKLAFEHNIYELSYDSGLIKTANKNIMINEFELELIDDGAKCTDKIEHIKNAYIIGRDLFKQNCHVYYYPFSKLKNASVLMSNDEQVSEFLAKVKQDLEQMLELKEFVLKDLIKAYSIFDECYGRFILDNINSDYKLIMAKAFNLYSQILEYLSNPLFDKVIRGLEDKKEKFIKSYNAIESFKDRLEALIDMLNKDGDDKTIDIFTHSLLSFALNHLQWMNSYMSMNNIELTDVK